MTNNTNHPVWRFCIYIYAIKSALLLILLKTFSYMRVFLVVVTLLYIFTAFITTLQYNHIVTVWHVVSLLLYAYVNLLWCDIGEGEWLYSPSFNSYILKSLQKCNKVPPKHHHIKHTHSYIHTHEHRYVHTILYGRSIWNINFCGNAATQVKRDAHKTKNLARWLSHHEKIFAYEIFFSEAKILDLFQCVSKMHTY